MAKMNPPGMVVAISAKPAKSAADGMPSPKGGRMPPPGMADKPMGDGKASPEEAHVIRADAHCIDCRNYDPTSGDCSEVAGSFDPQDACSEYFDAIGSDEPDDDDMGGAPDGDEDDSQGMTQ